MKKSIFLVLLVCFAYACSSDDDASNEKHTGRSSFVANELQYDFTSGNYYYYTPQDSSLVITLGGDKDNYNTIGISLPYSGSKVAYESGNAQDLDDVNINYTNEQTGVSGYTVIGSSLGDPLYRKGRFELNVSGIEKGKISGNFNFAVYSDNEQDSIIVKNGTFKNVGAINN